MVDEEIVLIASKVSKLLQFSNIKDNFHANDDFLSLENVSIYLSRVFEDANEVSDDICPKDFYRLVNKRISSIQAELYLMRIYRDNNNQVDSSKIYRDPLSILTQSDFPQIFTPKSRLFSFEPAILGWGWYAVESDESLGFYRWMRPGELSEICIPHLGFLKQRLKITGKVLKLEQYDSLVLLLNGAECKWEFYEKSGNDFTVILELELEDIERSSFVTVSISLKKFVSPNSTDERMLGALINQFELSLEDKVDEVNCDM